MNEFDSKVLDNLVPTGSSRAKIGNRKSIAAPKTPDEEQDIEITREITVLINGKRFQLVDVDGDVHFANKDNGHGFALQKNGDVIVLAGPGGNGNACGGRFMINSKGGQLVKTGPVKTEITAAKTDPANGDGSSSSTHQKAGEDKTSTAGGTADEAPAESCMVYGDSVKEVTGECTVNGKVVYIKATDVLYLEAGSKIILKTGANEAGGAIEINTSELVHKVDTLRDEIKSSHIRDGVPETTNIHYDPRSNTSSVGFHNYIQKISGDYLLEVGGSMDFQVLGLPNPNPVAFAADAATGDLTTKMKLSVAGGDFAVESTAGSILVKAGPDLSFPGVLTPGSLSVAAAGGAQISAGPDLSLPEVVAGGISMGAGKGISLDAATDIDITGKTGVNVEATAGDISILTTAGKIYLN